MMTIQVIIALVCGLIAGALSTVLILQAARKKPLKNETVFVPILGNDARPYGEKWRDAVYLRSVQALRDEQAFTSEVINAIESMRRYTDRGECKPGELRGANEGIKQLKLLLTRSAAAYSALENLEELSKRNKANAGNAMG